MSRGAARPFREVWVLRVLREPCLMSTVCYSYRPIGRISYERAFGPVGDLVVDHVCGNKACRQLSHLDPVTRAENVRRGDRGVTALVVHEALCPTPKAASV